MFRQCLISGCHQVGLPDEIVQSVGTMTSHILSGAISRFVTSDRFKFSGKVAPNRQNHVEKHSYPLGKTPKITIMVTFYVISEYSSTLPTKGGGEKIAGGPLYDLNRVKSITKDGTGLLLWTKDCAKDVQELGWAHSDVIDLIRRLGDRDYIDSEWCENGKGAWAACDAYSVNVVEWVPTADKEMRISYFVKFAINKLGTMVLTVSCHI